MTKRDELQKEFANLWIAKEMFGILYLCPRFGKIFTTINILERRKELINILIAYPDKKIKDSWKADFAKRNYSDEHVTYTTFASLKKHINKKYDLVIVDEIHLLSPAQILIMKQIKSVNSKILGLTGSLTSSNKKWLLTNLSLPITVNYSIAKGIEDGIIPDYRITVVTTPLLKTAVPGKDRSEKQSFNNYTYLINKVQSEGGESAFFRLQRSMIIKKSVAKLRMTKQLINDHNNDRILVFCGVTDIADSLGIPSYHSKSSERSIFEDFVAGKIPHMAVVKIGNTGVTYKPLNKVIINYFDSNAENMAQKINRCMSLEYDNPDKKADIYIVSSNEDVETKWLSKALEFFDTSKIKYL